MTTDAPLAPLTWFRVGGPASRLARPRHTEELAAVYTRSREAGLPIRLLGGGSNVLARDAGVDGVVIHLESPAFSDLTVDPESGRIRAGAAVPLTSLCSTAARAGLSGLESLIGIPGTVGGGLIAGAAHRHVALRSLVERIEFLDGRGQPHTADRDELNASSTTEPVVDGVLIAADFQLQRDDPEQVVRRMRHLWIIKREQQPYGHQSSGYIFRDPSPERSAASIVEAAGLKGMRAGNVEISDRNANFLIAHPGATAEDVTRLIDHVRDRIARAFQIELEVNLSIW
ncbi:UDP-N-acetylmuramate dehydrogenase [Isosphaera pallida]|uniref:UDP-N-acetylmuramate dehydrogenase n=1 Tax=Isosphaera pallida TaxID=128 RepID=UPI001FCC016C|nr:UDP-N-acetylmuramate dehydrogenase [Isosphaera pallida]